jgi:hypothetical protein
VDVPETENAKARGNRADQTAGIETGQRIVPNGVQHALMKIHTGAEVAIEEHVTCKKK